MLVHGQSIFDAAIEDDRARPQRIRTHTHTHADGRAWVFDECLAVCVSPRPLLHVQNRSGFLPERDFERILCANFNMGVVLRHQTVAWRLAQLTVPRAHV